MMNDKEYAREITTMVVAEIIDERARQDAKFGPVFHGRDYPDVGEEPDPATRRSYANECRRRVDRRAEQGSCTWEDILLEELAEATAEAGEGCGEKLRAELVQVAAVAVAWIEAIDNRAGKTLR